MRTAYKNEKQSKEERQWSIPLIYNWLQQEDKEKRCPYNGCDHRMIKLKSKYQCLEWFNQQPVQHLPNGKPNCPCNAIGVNEVVAWVEWQIQQDEE